VHALIKNNSAATIVAYAILRMLFVSIDQGYLLENVEVRADPNRSCLVHRPHQSCRSKISWDVRLLGMAICLSYKFGLRLRKKYCVCLLDGSSADHLELRKIERRRFQTPDDFKSTLGIRFIAVPKGVCAVAHSQMFQCSPDSVRDE
jgi:hypothetical protein